MSREKLFDLCLCEQCHVQDSCPSHAPPVSVPDSPVVPGLSSRAALRLPAGLELFSEGAHTSVPRGAGSEDGSSGGGSRTAGSNKAARSTDGGDDSGWMRFVRTSSEESHGNLQHGRQIRARPRLEAGVRPRVQDSAHRLRPLSPHRELHTEPEASVLPDLQAALSDDQPPAKKKKIDLIFRDVLEASLEDAAQSRSRPSSHGQSKQPDPKPSCHIQNLKVEEEEEQREEEEEEPSTSFCPNCVRLRRRILELEEELTRLRGGALGAVAPPASEQTPSRPAAPEGAVEELQGMELLPPAQAALDEDEQDAHSADESIAADPVVSPEDSSKPSSGAGRRIRRFKQEWLKKFWFLRYSSALNQMWCHVCRQYTVQSSRTSAFIVGSKQFKIHTIKLHSQSNLHKKCLQLYKLRMNPEKTEELSRNMSLLFNAAYHLAQEGRPFSDLRPLAELLKRCELKVVDRYLNEGDCRILVRHISRTLKEDLAQKMRLSPFLGLVLDAPNHDLFSDTVALYVRFIGAEGSARTEFLSLQRLNPGGADGYLQAIERAFGLLGLRFQDSPVVGLGVDGTNIPSGIRAHLYVAVQKSFPWILCLPILIRRPHLEVLDGISGKELSCLEELENNLKQLLAFYRYSPRMMSELRSTAPTLSEEAEFLGDIRAVRWIIGEPNVLNALIKDYLEVVAHLKEISSQTQAADAAAIALTLLQFLMDYQSLKLIYFLLDVIAVLSRLALTFQGEYLLVSQVEAKVEEAIREIGQLVDCPGEYLQEFEENFRESFNGVALKNLRVAESKFQSIREKICSRSQGILSQRLDLQSRSFTKACQVLDPSTWPRFREDLRAYGEEEIRLIFDHLESVPSAGRQNSRTGAGARDVLLGEWKDLKENYVGAGDFKEALGHVCGRRQRFPLLNRITWLLKVLPSSSSCCDKGRGSLLKACGNQRSRPTLEQMNDLLTVALNGPPIAAFDGRRALDLWFQEKAADRKSSSDHKSVLHRAHLNSDLSSDL